MRVKFYIVNRNNILLNVSYDGKRLQTTIGLQCNPKNWNNNNQRVKYSCSNAMDINKALDNAENITKSIYYEYHSLNKSPNPKEYKEKIQSRLRGEKSIDLDFIDFFEEFIEKSEKSKAKSTISDYRYTLHSLIECSKLNKTTLNWDTFNHKFYDDYMSYQFDFKKNSDNLFGKRIKVLKTALNKAVERGYKPNPEYKKFKVLQRESDDIYLNDEEIKRIANLNLNDTDLDLVRDMFLVGCYTGLRFSDIKQINRESIVDKYIKVRVKKTAKFITTILTEATSDILGKYDYCFPDLHNAIFNKKIKEVGRLAELDEIQETETYIGIKRTVTKAPKYKLISAHTSRRSFVTNLYKKGASVVALMNITGHKKETTFLRYVKVTKEESLQQLSELIVT